MSESVPHDVLVGGCRVRLVDAGPRDAPPMLLLHGGHGGWRHWVANIPALALHFRAVAPDMPGFGDSGDLPEPGVEALAAALGELIDTLSLKHVTAMGFSFGTLVTVALALQRPDTVARVMLINPPGTGARSPVARQHQEQIAAIARAQGARAGVVQTLQRLLLRDHSLIDEDTINAALQMAQQMRFYTRDISRGAQLLPQIEKLTQPLQVLIGACDPHQNHELVERPARLRAACRGEDVATVVPGAAHWLQRDRADWFNQRLAAFARGTPHQETNP